MILGQGVHSQGKSQGKKYFFKVRELLGNFEICQGILEFKQKSGNFEITSLYMTKCSKMKAKAVSSCLAIIIIIMIIKILILLLIIIKILCCIVVLRPSKVMSGRSVNLTTLFLGRLRPPKRLTSTSCTYFLQ